MPFSHLVEAKKGGAASLAGKPKMSGPGWACFNDSERFTGASRVYYRNKNNEAEGMAEPEQGMEEWSLGETRVRS